jgi:hypothetical protein
MFVAVLRVPLFYVKGTFHVSVFLTGRLFSPAKVISHRFEFSCTLLSYVSPNRLRLKLRRVEKLGRAADVTLSLGKRPECDFRYFSNSAALSVRHSDIGLECPRFPFGCVRNTAVVVSLKTFAKIAC